MDNTAIIMKGLSLTGASHRAPTGRAVELLEYATLRLTHNSTLRVEGYTEEHAGGGAILAQSSTVGLDRSSQLILNSNAAATLGGGLLLQGGSTLQVVQAAASQATRQPWLVCSNNAAVIGGCLVAADSVIVDETSVDPLEGPAGETPAALAAWVHGNAAAEVGGGAVYILSAGSARMNYRMSSWNISSNSAGQQAGGLVLLASNGLRAWIVEASQIDSNLVHPALCAASEACKFVQDNSDTAFRRALVATTFPKSGGWPVRAGGGLLVDGASLDLIHTSVRRNIARQGAGITLWGPV